MPAHSGHLSDPTEWVNPPVPQKWWRLIRDTMPAFDPDLTPTWHMGAIADAFRGHALRSNHPQVSFAARGPNAEYITRDHRLDFSLGEGSPLSRIYELDGRILFLGVDHSANTSLHLAEYRADFPGKKTVTTGAPVMTDRGRIWKAFQDIVFDQSDFPAIGEQFEKNNGDLIPNGRVARAQAKLFPQPAMVDYGVNWINTNRK